MFESIMKYFKKLVKDKKIDSKDTAKERLHLVLMQDRANVSADFLELMKQEIIDVIKKYIDVDESSIDVKLTNKTNGDGTTGAPILYANIPIVSIKDENKNKVIDEKAKKIEETKKQEKNEQPEKKQENEKPKENEDKDVKSSEIIQEDNNEEKITDDTKDKKEEGTESENLENKEEVPVGSNEKTNI